MSNRNKFSGRVMIRILPLLFCLLAQSAFADWRSDFEAIRIGFVSHSDQKSHLLEMESFRVYAEAALEFKVQLEPFTDENKLVRAIRANQIHYAMMSSSSFAATSILCNCLEPLAVPVSSDGSEGFISILATRADAGINALDDLEGKPFLLTSPGSLSGDILPRAALAKNGITIGNPPAPVRYSKSPAKSMQALVNRQADAVFVWSPAMPDGSIRLGTNNIIALIGNLKSADVELQVVWQSGMVPYAPHVALKTLPDDLKKSLSTMLSQMSIISQDAFDAVAPAFATGFALVDQQKFETLQTALKDLASMPVDRQ